MTGDQTPDLQSDALAKVGCEQVFSDTMNGAKAEQPRLAQALAMVLAADSLVVWWLDRLECRLLMTYGILTQHGGFGTLRGEDCSQERKEPEMAELSVTLFWVGVALTAAALFLVADITFSSEVRPLVPALQNNRRLAIHAAAMLISYSIIAVADVSAALYLVQGEGNRFERLPRASTLNDLTYKTVVAGFPILGLGIALGAYWGNIAWGVTGAGIRRRRRRWSTG